MTKKKENVKETHRKNKHHNKKQKKKEMKITKGTWKYNTLNTYIHKLLIIITNI